MQLKELNQHPNDEAIRFDEGPHIYYIDGQAYKTSVTKFIHSYFPQFNADKIIDKMMSSAKWKDSPYYGQTKEQIKKSWTNKGSKASSDGTTLHKQIENYYNQLTIDNPDMVEYQYFLQFHQDHIENKLIPFRTEWEVYDRDIELAGSIDMIYKNNQDGTYIIYDWKRCSNFKEENSFESGFAPLEHIPNCNKWHYSLQLNIYKYMLEKNYQIKISGMNLLILHPNNASYRIVKVPEMTEEINNIMINESNKKRKVTN